MPRSMPAKTAAAPSGQSAPPPPISFLKASDETTEYFGDTTTQMGASSVNVSDVKIPAFGYARSILVWVTLSGGVNGAGTVAIREDAPFTVLQNLALVDTNNRPLVGPFNGHHLYLFNKWLPTSQWALDVKNSPLWSAIDANGNGSFCFRLPIELGGRDALGAMENQKGDSRYRMAYDVAASSVVFSTAPSTTLPAVRVRFLYEAWSPVDAASPDGAPVQTAPPFPGTTQHLTLLTPDIASGDKKVLVDKVGDMIRGLVLIGRNSSGVRANNVFPETIRVSKDKRPLHIIHTDLQRNYMWERSGQAPDTGVLVFDFEHDLDGRVGAGMREQWLGTTSATRLEFEGQWGSGAAGGSLQILVNDVAPAGGLVAS